MTVSEIKASIAAEVAAGNGDIIEKFVTEWAGCQGATVYENGVIWIEQTQSGYFLPDEDLVEFWAWNQDQ